MIYKLTESVTLSNKCKSACIGGSKGGARDARPPGGPNSFIFMQFLAKKLQNNSTFGSWRPLLGEILDPPLALGIYSRHTMIDHRYISLGEIIRRWQEWF